MKPLPEGGSTATKRISRSKKLCNPDARPSWVTRGREYHETAGIRHSAATLLRIVQERRAEARDYIFLISCPPNLFLITASSRSANDSSSRERNRSIRDMVMTGAETL